MLNQGSAPGIRVLSLLLATQRIELEAVVHLGSIASTLVFLVLRTLVLIPVLWPVRALAEGNVRFVIVPGLFAFSAAFFAIRKILRGHITHDESCWFVFVLSKCFDIDFAEEIAATVTRASRAWSVSEFEIRLPVSFISHGENESHVGCNTVRKRTDVARAVSL